MNQDIIDKIKDLAARGAIFYINHSGGKDSQTMTIEMQKLVPASQLVVIHAHLPGVEWSGIREHIQATAGHLPYIETQSHKTFFQMVANRGKFPGYDTRQCTSDLKRDPISKAIIQDLLTKGYNGRKRTSPHALVVNCIGIRAEESPRRKKLLEKKGPIYLDTRLTIKNRTAYTLHPIGDYTLDQVWQTIEDAGQRPHWVYSEGMTRLSCCFCIYASAHDLKTAARLKPDLYRRYCETEKEINFTLQMGGSLPELTGINPDGSRRDQAPKAVKPPTQQTLFDGVYC